MNEVGVAVPMYEPDVAVHGEEGEFSEYTLSVSLVKVSPVSTAGGLVARRPFLVPPFFFPILTVCPLSIGR